MLVELVPVLEIGYNNQNIPVPDKFPKWEFPEIWDKYNRDSYKKAGFKDIFTPYLPGLSFFRLSNISENNLAKIIRDHTEDFKNGKYDRDQVSALFGGYILRIDGQDKFFPQCCGDLGDIFYWEQLANGNKYALYEGHPAPIVKIENDSIFLDFSVEENDEPFQPTPPETILRLDRESLKLAIEEVKVELNHFSDRLKLINEQEKFGVEEIEKLLAWNNANDF